MINLGIVIAPWRYWYNPLKIQPLWELYYATLIRKNFSKNINIEFIDLRGKDFDLDKLEIPEKDLYFYSLMKSADAFDEYDTVKHLKSKFTKSKHLAWGTHVDNFPEEALKNFDHIFLGSAEKEIIQFFQNFINGNPSEQVMEKRSYLFKDYHFAERDFINRELIVNKDHFQEYGNVDGTGVYFSRGCSFNCSFCVYNNPNRFEYKTPEQIKEEIIYLKENFGIKGVNLKDEVALPVNKKFAIDFIDAIGNSDVIWRGQTVPLGHEEVVKIAAESGCKELALGIESVDSDKVLEISNKPSKSIENNIRYIEILKKHGIKVKICLIFGLPGESDNIVENTVKFIEKVKPDYASVSGFDPVPGSVFYNHPEKYGIKSIDKDLRKHAHLLYRFGSEDDELGLPFEYHEETPFGKGKKRTQILSELKTIQDYLRDNSLSY